MKELQVDRTENWDKFAKIMHNYISSFTVDKYGAVGSIDLMHFTEPRICIWNILKYAIRLWNGKGKINDIQKIAHYAEMAWTLSKGDLSKVGITDGIETKGS